MSDAKEKPIPVKTSSDSLPERPENFRASCDSCAKSKVRCGKEQPRCQRCIYQGVHCVYSPSQRSRKKRLASIDATHRRDRIRAPALSGVHKNVAPLSPPQSEAGHVSAVTSPGQNQFMIAADISETEITAGTPYDSFTPLNFFDTELDSFMKLGCPITPRTQPTRRGTSTVPDHFQTQQWLHTNSVEPKCLENDDMLDIFSINDEQISETSIHKIPTEPSFGLGSQAADQHWPSLAFSTLQSLDIPTTCCSSLTLNLDSSLTAESSRSLDNVLRVNQAAMENVLTILDCPCTADTNLALLISMIFFKILSWYEAGLNCSNNNNNSDSSTPASTMSDSPFASSPSTYASSPSLEVESVFMAPISIGAYELDAEHRRPMIAQLILTELGKMNRVVDGFSRKYGRGGAKSTENSRGQLHCALETSLRSSLKTTMLAAREQLDDN